MVTDTNQRTTVDVVRDPPSHLNAGARLLDKIIFLCLLVLIVGTLIPYGTTEPWWEAVFECAVFVLTALYVIEGLLAGNWKLNRLFIALPLVLMTAYAFIQIIPIPGAARRTLTIDPYQTYMTARKTLALTLFFSVLLLHVSTLKRLRWLARVVMAAGIASALFGILRQSLQSPDSTKGFILPYLFYGAGYGQFFSSNAFGYLMEMSLALLVGLLAGGGTQRKRVLIYITAAVVVWAAMILCNSRGSLMGFLGQAIFLTSVSLSWYFRRDSPETESDRALVGRALLLRGLVTLAIVATLIVGAFWMGGQSLALKFEGNAVAADVDGVTRREIWHSTWGVFKEHPITGVGFGAYFLAITNRQIGSGKVRVEQAHNDYLDLAANGGVIALALAAWFILMVIRRAKSSLRSRDFYRRAVALGALAGILSVGVHSVVDFGLQVTGLALICGALIVIAIADVETKTRRRRRVIPADQQMDSGHFQPASANEP